MGGLGKWCESTNKQQTPFYLWGGENPSVKKKCIFTCIFKGRDIKTVFLVGRGGGIQTRKTTTFFIGGMGSGREVMSESIFFMLWALKLCVKKIFLFMPWAVNLCVKNMFLLMLWAVNLCVKTVGGCK